jgi:nitrous oxidase accessory protein
VDVRDGLYLQNSSKGTITGNHVTDVRYGLHYMFSDDNVFEDNLFENGAAGSAIMYSERIVFRRNRFLRNRGFASVGLLLQQCDDVLAESNLIADNARGIFLEGTNRTYFRGNIVAKSDIAIVAFGSAVATRFEHNSFVGNMSPLMLVGKQLDATFDGNFWSGHREPDLDGDGRTDRPYRLVSVFDHLRGNLTAADLYVDGFAATALGMAETAFPVLAPASISEPSPLARPPALPDVPLPDDTGHGRNTGGMAVSAVALLAGAAGLRSGRRGPWLHQGARS